MITSISTSLPIASTLTTPLTTATITTTVKRERENNNITPTIHGRITITVKLGQGVHKAPIPQRGRWKEFGLAGYWRVSRAGRPCGVILLRVICPKMVAAVGWKGAEGDGRKRFVCFFFSLSFLVSLLLMIISVIVNVGYTAISISIALLSFHYK